MQYSEHKTARQVFNEIDKYPKDYLIIHYSCESFYDDLPDGRNPRITAIAVSSFATTTIELFSIHKVAEKEKLLCSENEPDYDRLEYMMLSEYFEYVKDHKDKKWIHWHMRDINFGFQAIAHRYEVLGGRPTHIDDSHKYDLAVLLQQCYGCNYADHPRMKNILLINGIEAKDFLSGEEESQAFKNKEYRKLQLSTLRKVNVFKTILKRTINGDLKVQSKWYEIYGVSVQGVFDYLYDRWWGRALFALLTLIAGALLGKYVF